MKHYADLSSYISSLKSDNYSINQKQTMVKLWAQEAPEDYANIASDHLTDLSKQDYISLLNPGDDITHAAFVAKKLAESIFDGYTFQALLDSILERLYADEPTCPMMRARQANKNWMEAA